MNTKIWKNGKKNKEKSARPPFLQPLRKPDRAEVSPTVSVSKKAKLEVYRTPVNISANKYDVVLLHNSQTLNAFSILPTYTTNPYRDWFEMTGIQKLRLSCLEKNSLSFVQTWIISLLPGCSLLDEGFDFLP